MAWLWSSRLRGRVRQVVSDWDHISVRIRVTIRIRIGVGTRVRVLSLG